MDPVLFELPWGPAHAYGTLILIGGLSCAPGLAWEIRDRRLAQGRQVALLLDVYLVLVFGAAIGGRLLHVLTMPGPLGRNVGQLWAAYDGGFVFFGSLLAIALGWAWVARRYAIPFATLCDLGSTWIPLGHAFGRLGCFMAGCCWGAPTDAGWGVHFPPEAVVTMSGTVARAHGHTVALVPVQLVEAGALVLLFVVLLVSRRRHGSEETSWRATARYAVGYGIIRCFTEVLRGDTSRGMVLEVPMPFVSGLLHLPAEQPLMLSVSQLVAAALVLGGLGVLRMRRRTP